MSLRKQLARLLFSAMGVPTEGQLLGFDNAVQLPAWVDPAGGGGGTLGIARAVGATAIDFGAASKNTPVALGSAITVPVGTYMVVGRMRFSRSTNAGAFHLRLSYTGALTASVGGGRPVVISHGAAEGSAPLIAAADTLPSSIGNSNSDGCGNINSSDESFTLEWKQMITVTVEGTLTFKVGVNDDELSGTFSALDGMIYLQQVS